MYGATVYAKMYCDDIEIAGYSNTDGVVVHIWDHDAPTFVWAEDHTSLTATLTCKIVTTHTLSDTTTEIAVDDTTDPDWIYYTGTVILDGVSHTDTAQVENEIISVYISWTEFTFVYTVEWNPETLQYEGTGWEPIAENGGEITVRNDGNVNVNVSFEYVVTETTVTGEFVNSTDVAVTSPVALAVGAETKVKLTLYGDPVETFISGVLGNVTVTVKKSDTASLP